MGFFSTLSFFWSLSPLVLIPLCLVLFFSRRRIQQENRQYKQRLGISDQPSYVFVNQEAPSPAQPPPPSPATSSVPKQPAVLIYTHTAATQPIAAPKPMRTPETRRISTINVVLALGAVFIILAGAVFATTSWQTISDGLKVIIILSVAFLFFGISILAEKKLQIEKTGLAFFVLGSIFLPISMLSLGFFGLLGDWLSLAGQGRFMLLALTFFLAAVTCFWGAHRYAFKGFFYGAFLCITTVVLCSVWQCVPQFEWLAFGASLYALLGFCLHFAVEKRKKPLSPVLSAILKHIHFINLLLAGALLFLHLPNSAIASLAAGGLLVVNVSLQFLLYKDPHLKVVHGICSIATVYIATLLLPITASSHQLAIFCVGLLVLLLAYKFTVRFRCFVGDFAIVIASFLSLAIVYISMWWNSDIYGLLAVAAFICILTVLVVEASANGSKSLICGFYPAAFSLLFVGNLSLIDSFRIGFFAYGCFLFALAVLCLLPAAKVPAAISAPMNVFRRILMLYTMAVGILGALLEVSAHHTEIYPYLWGTAIMIGVLAWQNREKSKNLFAYLFALCVLCASSLSMVRFLGQSSECLYAPAALLVLGVLGFYTYCAIKKTPPPYASVILDILAYGGLAVGFLLYFYDRFHFAYHTWPAYQLITMGCLIASYAAFYKRKENFAAAVSAILLYPAVMGLHAQLSAEHSWNAFAPLALFLCLAITGRLIHKKLLVFEKNQFCQIDWLTLCNAVAAYYVYINIFLFDFAATGSFAILAVYGISCYRRTNPGWINQLAVSAAGIFALFAFWKQPFITFPEVIATEIQLLPLGLLCVCLTLTWKNRKPIMAFINFVVATASVVVLALEAIDGQLLVDALILGCGSLGLLVAAYLIKSKRWFLLSSITLLSITLYLSRGFWTSLQWWVYLLAVGILLISIASANEVQKKKGGEHVKKRLSRFMSDWKW